MLGRTAVSPPIAGATSLIYHLKKASITHRNFVIASSGMYCDQGCCVCFDSIVCEHSHNCADHLHIHPLRAGHARQKQHRSTSASGRHNAAAKMLQVSNGHIDIAAAPVADPKIALTDACSSLMLECPLTLGGEGFIFSKSK